MLDAVARAIALAGGCGHCPRAPGTAGALVAALLFVGATSGLRAAEVAPALALTAHAGVVGVLGGLGTWAAGRAERIFGRHDDGRIVIDEVVGQWIALLPVAVVMALPSTIGDGLLGDAAGPVREFFFPGAVVTGFVLFRVFDVWKPGWVRWAERHFHGGWGVMADDLVAGAYAALLLSLAIVTAVSVPGFEALRTAFDSGSVVRCEGVYA